jgi:hypothetical protein
MGYLIPVPRLTPNLPKFPFPQRPYVVLRGDRINGGTRSLKARPHLGAVVPRCGLVRRAPGPPNKPKLLSDPCNDAIFLN